MSSLALCSLTDWSKTCIQEVFEATSTKSSMAAISRTFSKNVEATINGMPLTYDGLERLVTTMRESSSKDGLKVRWLHAVEVARDPTNNRDGAVGGFYIIGGILKTLHSGEVVEHERHKAVNVIIESQSSDFSIDSRRVTTIVFVGSDRPVSATKL